MAWNTRTVNLTCWLDELRGGVVPSHSPAAGLYDVVLTEGLRRRLAIAAPELQPLTDKIDPAEASTVLARHVHEVLERLLDTLSSGADALNRQVELCNRLLVLLPSVLGESPSVAEDLAAELVTPELLVALIRRQPLAAPIAPPRPSFPLSETHLLVNARGEHSVGGELEREIASADHIDLLCSFMLWSGFRQLKHALESFFRRPGTSMRVITTVYMGVTQPRVLEELFALGANVRISFETRRTRLHAKAWLLRRHTGFSTAFIGSSNLSAKAMTDGLEWNVRVGSDTRAVIKKFEAAFESYWNDTSFEPYDPQTDAARLHSALKAARADAPYNQTFLEPQPYPFQSVILERLQAERDMHGRFRNLVVAATGTGKTLIAAFDFRRLREQFRRLHGHHPRLLFIAHRRELLTQARDTFRHVIRDASFGELLVDGHRPQNGLDVFASIQSLSRLDLTALDPRAFDIIIVDEFHHAAAASYEAVLTHLHPWVLLGLTATPERYDGTSVMGWFDGRMAVELRLWDAIEQGLLVPFRYYGLRDVVDMASYWRRERRQLDFAALGNALTGHHVRALQVLAAVHDYVEDPRMMRAIGFCVSQEHARFMAEQFTRAGLSATTVLGDDADREESVRRLRSGQLQAVFTVDVLNEGVDIPEVDTVLLLRPTDSATIFLQQLGRGLRQAPEKRCLTVLDLVASPDRSFRLDRRYLSLLRGPRRAVLKQLEEGLPLLPPGCSIQLTDDAREVVIASLKAALPTRSAAVIEELRRCGPRTTLKEFCSELSLSLREVYRYGCWTRLRRRAGFISTTELAETPDVLEKGLTKLIGFDDLSVIWAALPALTDSAPPAITDEWLLLLVALFGEAGVREPEKCMDALWEHPVLRDELGQLLSELADSAPYVQTDLAPEGIPLRLHAHYQRKQIEYALSKGAAGGLPNSREGVVTFESNGFDALFVQLRKSEKDFSPSTMYDDYAISTTRFHWQSQATTAPEHKRGLRHIEHKRLGVRPLLFVRMDGKDERGITFPYLFLGPVEYSRHEGSRPISIEWELSYPMPTEFFESACVVV